MSKAIETVYHGSTETKPARITASDSDNNRITISEDSSTEEAHKRAAWALRDKMGWTGNLIGAGTKRGYVWVFLPDEFLSYEPGQEALRGVLVHLECLDGQQHAFRYADQRTGIIVEAVINANNVRQVGFWLNGGSWDKFNQRYSYHVQELKIREYERIVKGWAYVGADPETVAEYIKQKLLTW